MRKLAMAFALILGACTSSTPTTTPSTPTPTPTPTPSPTGTVTAKPAPGGSSVKLTAAGAFLRPVDAEGADERPLVDGDCQSSFRADGATDTACNVVEMGGGRVYWVVNIVQGMYDVQIRTHIASADVWQVVLQTVAHKGLTLVDGIDAELAADGGNHLILGYRGSGEARSLSYDVIAWPRPLAKPVIVMHRGGLTHGSVQVVEDGLDEFSGDTLDGSKPCCPKRYQYLRMTFSGRNASVAQQRWISPEDVPPSAI